MTLAADPVFREGGGAGEGGGRSSAGKLRVGLRDRVSKLLCAGAGAVRSSQHMFEGPSSADRWPLPDPTAESRSQPSNDPRRAIPAQGGRGQAHVAEEQLQLLEASTERANSGREAGSRSDREGYARTRLDERRATVMRDSSSAYGSLRGMSFLDSEEELEQVLGDLVGQIRNGSPMQQAAAVERLFNTVADSDPARQVVSQLGAVPGLIGLLQTGSDPSKMYAAYTLSSLTSLSLSRNQMIEMSVAGHLVELLKTCPLMVAKKGAMRALGRLGRDPKAAQQVVNAGALPLIISLLSNEDSSLVRRCLIALYFIGSDKEPLQVEICKAGALLQCMGLCSSQEADVQTEAVEVVKMLFRCPLAHAQLLREAPEVLGTLRNAALNGNSSRTRSSAAKALSRLENSGSAELRSMVMAVSNGAHPPTQAGAREQEASADMDMMRQLTAIITRGNSQLRAQAAQAVMDVAAEDLSASRELAECGIVGPLIELVIHGNSDGRLYAASALAKMALEPTVLESIFQDGAVPPLVCVICVLPLLFISSSCQ